MSAPKRCKNCGFVHVAGLSPDEAPPAVGSPCPGCGYALEAEPVVQTEHGLSSVRDYFLTLREIHFEPTSFFRRLPAEGGIARPLAFALITHWLATAINFLGSSALGSAFSGLAARLKGMQRFESIDYVGGPQRMAEARERLMSWFWGASSVIADPFLTLVKILATSLLVYLGARLLVPRKTSYETSVRVVSYGMAPALVASVPFLGTPVSELWILVATVIGARELYRVGTGRALLVTLFPKVLVFGLVIAIFMTGLLVLLGIISISFM